MTVEERFWAKVDKTEGCWLWTAATDGGGRGAFKWRGSMQLAHRVAYELTCGLVPEDRELDHRTTCPKHCVNPDHLTPVTHKQNMENRAGAQVNSRSGVRGVVWEKRKRRWWAVVRHNRKTCHVGYFNTVEEAEAAVIAKRLELFTNSDRELANAG